jgi:hypothetical protein
VEISAKVAAADPDTLQRWFDAALHAATLDESRSQTNGA